MKLVKANDKTTLLLDSAWMPINVLTARAAFHHHLKNRVRGLDKNILPFSFSEWHESNHIVLHSDQPSLKSASNAWPIPTIAIITEKFFKKPRKKEYSFDEFCIFYDFTCRICLKKFPKRMLNIDHVIPRSKNGTNFTENKLLTCKSCNSKKGNQHPYHDKTGKVLTGTKIPANFIFLEKNLIRKEWEQFLFINQ